MPKRQKEERLPKRKLTEHLQRVLEVSPSILVAHADLFALGASFCPAASGAGVTSAPAARPSDEEVTPSPGKESASDPRETQL